MCTHILERTCFTGRKAFTVEFFYIGKTWRVLSIQYSLSVCIISNVQPSLNRALAITNPWALHCPLLNSYVTGSFFRQNYIQNFVNSHVFLSTTKFSVVFKGPNLLQFRKDWFAFTRIIDFYVQIFHHNNKLINKHYCYNIFWVNLNHLFSSCFAYILQ